MNSGGHIRTANLPPRLRAAGLVLPLLAFIGLTFVAPLATMLLRSVYDSVVAEALPETLGLLRQWDGKAPPPKRCTRQPHESWQRRARSGPSVRLPAA